MPLNPFSAISGTPLIGILWVLVRGLARAAQPYVPGLSVATSDSPKAKEDQRKSQLECSGKSGPCPDVIIRESGESAYLLGLLAYLAHRASYSPRTRR